MKKYGSFLLTHALAPTICAIVILLLIIPRGAVAQRTSWRKLAEAGASYYDIKAAFMRENAGKLKELRSRKLEKKKQGRGAELEEEENFFEIFQFMRWSEWVEPRVKETNGDLKLMSARAQNSLQTSVSKNRLTTLGTNSWTLLGPQTQTNQMFGNGRVNTVRVDPANTDILYACTPASQLFKSTNAGVSWTAISNGIPAPGVTDVAIDPTNSDILYAITGDADRALYHPYTSGLYKSINGGISWNTTGLTAGQSNFDLLTGVIIDPVNHNTVIVSGNSGIYRTTDGAASFVKTYSGSTRNLVFQPGNSSIVLAGSNSRKGAVIVRSADNGISWTNIINGLSTDAYRYAVDISPLNPQLVYAWACNAAYSSLGVYCSTDGGISFRQMTGGTPNMCSSQGWYDLCITADPDNPAVVYAGGVDVYRSSDSGKNWINLTKVYTAPVDNSHADVHGLTFAPDGTFYVANDGGVYASSNKGNSYTNKSSNLSIAQPYGLATSSFDSKLIVSGHQDNGTNMTNDILNWRNVLGGDGLISMIDRTNDSVIYATRQYGNAYRSDDGGQNFVYLSGSLPSTNVWLSPLLQDPIEPSTVYFADNVLYKSLNRGDDWVPISPLTGSYTSIRSVDVDKHNTKIIWLATSAGIYKTINGGTDWLKSSNLPNIGFTAVHTDQNNSDIIYAAAASYTGNSFFKSVNGGGSWVLWSDGLPKLPVNTVISQLGSPGELYCGTDDGIYYRKASDAAWSSFNVNLPSVPVRDLKIFYPTGKLRAATFGRGLWENDLQVAVNCPAPFVNGVVYVNVAASGSNNGASWANAFTGLQPALAACRTCGAKQIWIAGGTYYPDQGAGITNNDRNASFSMVNGVAIFGGFAGTETNINQRNLAAHPVILSGDIQQDGNTANNSFNLFKNLNISASSVLDGLILEGGASATEGGAMFNNMASPVIRNCIFRKNTAANFGGAVYNSNASPLFINCLFAQNSASYGGAVYSETGSPILLNCTASANTASSDGLFTFCAPASMMLFTNCIVWGNSGSGPVIGSALPGTVTVGYSIVQGGYAGTANIDADPLFANAATADYSLELCSPAVNAGDATALPMGDTSDLAGMPRVAFATIDMGAYEKQTAGPTNPVFVDITATGNNDGSSWINAFTSLENALNELKSCAVITTLHIAAGTYTAPAGLGYQFDKLNAIILGGYPKGGGTRNAAANPVVIKGNVQVLQSAQLEGVKILK